ncbi:glycosyltransferase [Aureispira sp. CCB-E]|uniref:glycosyltransferase n=1 Tax=Aureispira sp. CCB-E TaxID=3051121 RepID=UPI002868EB79|nr:glycosyltransferase [Aureispira sp. CCB-E]WMX13653.1 glycosyltransferase [Aureispira sp. CCB-E]
MKIVIIGPAHPLRGGLAEFNERIAREFIEMGDDVHIVTFSLQYPNFLFPGKTQYSEEPQPVDLDIDVAMNSVNPFNWLAIGNKIRKMQPDLVVCRFWLPFMGPCLGTILRQIKKNRHTKIVSIIDNIIPHEKRIGDKTFAKYFVKPVDGFVVMSRSVEAELQAFITQQQKVVYIPHPIYDSYGAHWDKKTACAALNIPFEQPYLLFFGFIRKYKGLDILLEAMGDPRIRNLGVRLIVAGEFYDSEAVYRELIEKHNLHDLLILRTDYIPKDEVGAYFGAADMVVQPYRTATQSGISQLAYHFEVPMLVTKVGGLPEVVEHNKVGYVVAPNNATEVADGIVNFYQNNRAAEFRKGVQARKADFSWASLINGIKALMSPSNDK